MSLELTAHNGAPRQPRYDQPALDGLRFFAFFAVLLHHIAPPAKLTTLSALSLRGWVGVEMFFVISSFLFFTLFKLEYARTGGISTKDFYVRRLLRLYPLMIGAPILFIAVEYSRVDVWAALKELAFIDLFAENIPALGAYTNAIPFAGHLWTLSFEFQIYLVILFLLCVRLGYPRALLLLAGIVLLCVIPRATYALAKVPHPAIYFSPLLRPDSILLGMALAMVTPFARGHVRLASVALIASAAMFFNLPNVFETGSSTILLFPVAAVMCGSTLWLALNVPWLTKLLSNRVLV
jgi:peptidoglycan/LPS O-acetylase OafA/YrhL